MGTSMETLEDVRQRSIKAGTTSLVIYLTKAGHDGTLTFDIEPFDTMTDEEITCRYLLPAIKNLRRIPGIG